MKIDDLFLRWAPRMLSIMRIITALLFLQHGTAKLFGFPHVPALDDIHPISIMMLSGVFELVGGSFLLLGLFTRTTSFILSGNMAAAYFIAHASVSFFPIINGGELAILFCFIFLYFVFVGGGSWSLDALRERVRILSFKTL